MAANYPATPIVAVMLWYEGIADALFPNSVRPDLLFGQAPQTNADATQRRIPYVAIEDSGHARDVQSDNGGPEAGEFLVQVFDYSLGDVARAALAIRFGGRPPEDRAGLDGGTLQLDAPFSPVNITLDTIQFGYAGEGLKNTGSTLPNGQPETTIARIHKAEMRFRSVYEVLAKG